MNKANTLTMDPLIEGYLRYLDKVGRKTPRTIVDVRCTLRRAIAGLERVRPSVALWRLTLEDYLHWLETERQSGCTESSLAKYLSHVRGLPGIRLAEWPRRAQRARRIQSAAYLAAYRAEVAQLRRSRAPGASPHRPRTCGTA